ncbi:ribulose bisphosphate carboxylase small subunit [Azospirillum sp.]|uniref:ribulose bisphosphate carboxylase small subunit n=1 Tax=Azospirillum sp. TaxID=34012 RepID=UPI003D71BD93
MRLTQGQFSFLPDLTDGEITMQVQYALDQGWAVAVEFTRDPHPRNTYWTMWGNPMFDLRDAKGVMMEIDACRKANPDQYVKVLAFDSSEGFETVRMSYLVNRPADEPGFELVRAEGPGRRVDYTVRSHATARPEARHGA